MFVDENGHPKAIFHFHYCLRECRAIGLCCYTVTLLLSTVTLQSGVFSLETPQDWGYGHNEFKAGDVENLGKGLACDDHVICFHQVKVVE